MNPLAEQLNQTIKATAPHVYDMLSDVGKKLFFPKGILSQSAEAKEKAHAINATIGIAKEDGRTMHFDTVMASINNIRPSESLTYAPSFGIPALRKQWQAEMVEKNPSLAGKTVSLPVVTCGITHGIATFADVWTNPGDVIILPEMMWGNYNMIFSVRKNARIRHYELFTAAGGFNLAAFEQGFRRIKRVEGGREQLLEVTARHFQVDAAAAALVAAEDRTARRLCRATARRRKQPRCHDRAWPPASASRIFCANACSTRN